MIEKINIALVKINNYLIKPEKDGSMRVTLPKQYLEDNKGKGDTVVIYRNAHNDTELVIRVEKVTQK